VAQVTRYARLAFLAVLLATPATIRAQNGDPIASLAQAAEAAPNDAAAQARLSQAHAAANEPAAALRAIGRALAIQPQNPEYLRSFAVLATWVGSYGAAEETFETLAALQPDDESVLLNLARVRSWSGDTDAAVETYRRYLRRAPATPEPWLELATAESWRGNFAGAVNTLESYRSRFGESPAYAVTLARVYAAAGRPSRAVALLDPLPADYDVQVARTIALTVKRNVGAARASLASVRQLDAANVQTRNAERLLRATLGSAIHPQVSFYSDSDRVRTFAVAPTASVMLSSGTRIAAGWGRHVLQGTAASGLGRTDGRSAKHDHVWAELGQTLGPLTLSGRAGSARIDGFDRTPYEVGARLQVTDTLGVGATRREGFMLTSPRALELGLTERRHQIDAAWTPTLRLTVLGEATHQELSDGNRRWETRIAPQWAVARRASINLDLGAAAYRLATDIDLANGYYDPRVYEAYQVTAYPYLKISENVGTSIALAIGGQREQGMPFRLGGSGAAELTVGIYRAWLLRVSGSVTHNFRQESGAFRGSAGSIALVKRF
jgi:Flp pilus assembly protein TadD